MPLLLHIENKFSYTESQLAEISTLLINMTERKISTLRWASIGILVLTFLSWLTLTLSVSGLPWVAKSFSSFDPITQKRNARIHFDWALLDYRVCLEVGDMEMNCVKKRYDDPTSDFPKCKIHGFWAFVASLSAAVVCFIGAIMYIVSRTCKIIGRRLRRIVVVIVFIFLVCCPVASMVLVQFWDCTSMAANIAVRTLKIEFQLGNSFSTRITR